MGWWRIKDIESGQVDFDHECPTNEKLANAVPGKDDADGLYNGDGPADTMSDTLRGISKVYEDKWDRPAKKEELTAVFNFCCNGMFR